MREVPGKLQSVPVIAEQPRFQRFNVRQHHEKDSAGFEPTVHEREKLPRMIHVFQEVKRRNHVEAFRGEGSFLHVPDEYFRAAGGSSLLRRGRFQLDAVKFPGVAPHGFQKRAGTASDIEDRAFPACSGESIRRCLRQRMSAAVSPAIMMVLLIILIVVNAHLFGLGRTIQPYPEQAEQRRR